MIKIRLNKPLFTSLLLLCSIACITSCSQSTEQAFRIGTNLWPGYEPLYLARHKQYLNEHIHLVEYPSTTEVLRAFRNNSLEAACLTLDEALLLRQYDVPVTVILVTDISEGGDVIIARPGINSVSELDGKTVGVESSALGAYVITRALEKNHMSLPQIKIKHMSVDNHKRAFENGKVDAVATFEPVRTQLLALGGKEIFSSREIPGEIVDVMVINNNALITHRQNIHIVIDGWFKALQDLVNNPQASAQIISRRQKIPAAQVMASYQGMKLPTIVENRRLLGGQQPLLNDNIARLKTLMENEKLLQPGVSVSDLLSDQFIPDEP